MNWLAETLFGLLVFPGFLFTLFLGMIGCWLVRKLSALIQWRVGPPWYQPWLDVMKLMGKELITPKDANWPVFYLAPAVALSASMMVATVLWQAALGRTIYLGDLIVVLYLTVIPSLALVLGGSASASPHAGVGASREMKLALAYELPLALAITVAVIKAGNSAGQAAGTLELQVLSANKPIWSLSGIMAFLVAIVCIQAKLGQVPFDLAEAETELAGGTLIEYSGVLLAIWKLVQAMLLVALPLLVVVVFLGGFGSGPGGLIAGSGKFLLIWILLILIRNTNPRVRIDQALRFFWFGAGAVAVVAVVLAMLGNIFQIRWL